MDFKDKRLMMSKEEARNRAKELLNENQADLITKYMFLEQQCKRQKEVIDKAIEYIRNHQLVFKDATLEETEEWFNQFYIDVLDILKEEEND